MMKSCHVNQFILILTLSIVIFVGCESSDSGIIENGNNDSSDGVNISLSSKGATATAISEGTYLGVTHPASWAIDGDQSSSWSSQWSIPAWLKVDFGSDYKITKVGILWGSHQHEFSISLSLDGSNWTTVVSSRMSNNSEGASLAYETFNITDTDARFMKIDMTTTSAPSSHIFQATVQEFEAYSSN